MNCWKYWNKTAALDRNWSKQALSSVIMQHWLKTLLWTMSLFSTAELSGGRWIHSLHLRQLQRSCRGGNVSAHVWDELKVLSFVLLSFLSQAGLSLLQLWKCKGVRSQHSAAIVQWSFSGGWGCFSVDTWAAVQRLRGPPSVSHLSPLVLLRSALSCYTYHNSIYNTLK